MKSFRLRIILWTIVIAGAVMLAFGVSGNIAFERMKLKQVDESLQLHIERLPMPPSHLRFWDRTGPDLHAELEKRFAAEAIVAVYTDRSDRNSHDVGEGSGLVSWGGLSGLFSDENLLPPTKGVFDPKLSPPRTGRLGQDILNRARARIGRLDQSLFEANFLSLRHSENGDMWRVAYAEHPGFNVLLAVNYESIREDTALMRRSFIAAFPLALMAMGASIWFFVTRAIKPVNDLTSAIERVSVQSLKARLTTEGSYSEFSTLIQHFNSMLARLDRSFTQATRFSADAAHELKTPLTILQGQLELALQAAEDNSSQQTLLAGLLDETHRLKSITRKLLILAKADAGTLEAQLEKVDMQKLLGSMVELAREDDLEANMNLSCEETSDFHAFCDETLTRQVLNNLIGNALKYRSPPEQTIELKLKRESASIVLEIWNRCEPLGADTRSRLFDRFIRADKARNRAAEGTGLGLSLSLEFAKAQGGDLSLIEGTGDSVIAIRFALRSAT